MLGTPSLAVENPIIRQDGVQKVQAAFKQNKHLVQTQSLLVFSKKQQPAELIPAITKVLIQSPQSGIVQPDWRNGYKALVFREGSAGHPSPPPPQKIGTQYCSPRCYFVQLSKASDTVPRDHRK